MKTTLVRTAATLAITLPTVALAAPRSVTQTAQYTLADNDSRTVARQICASTAKRTALDKSGSLFESGLTASRSETKGKVADDAHLEMRSYVAAVVASETIAEHYSVKNDRVTLSCTVKLTYDPDEMGARLKKTAAGNAEVTQHLAAQQAQIDILENQLKTLRANVEAPAAETEPVAAQPPQATNLTPEAMYPPPPSDQAAAVPPPQIAEVPQAPPPVPARKPRQLAQNNAAPIPLYPPQPSDAPQYDPLPSYDPPVVAPPPASWPAPAPVAYPVATYAQPAPAYYYYPPAPAYYAPRVAYYAPRGVYRGWYYGGGRRW